MSDAGRKHDPAEVIGAIALRARERGCVLTKTRFVKFLYLLDVLWARDTGGETYTGWPWRFVHFGPFCGESVDAIAKAEKFGAIIARDMSSRLSEDTTIYSAGEMARRLDFETFRQSLPLGIAGEFQGLIDRFCDDTPGLLNHVYFHTIPMARAKPQEPLGFAGIEKPNLKGLMPVKIGNLSPEQKEKARTALQKLAARATSVPGGEIRDEHYYRFLADTAEEEMAVGVEGVALIEDGW
jgi:hypothetical protein